MRPHLLCLAALALASTSAPAQKVVPSTSTTIRIEANGMMLGVGHSISGLNTTTSQVVSRTSTATGSSVGRALPGQAKEAQIEVGGILLTSQTNALMQWAQSGESGHAEARDVLLTFMKPDGTPATQYLLHHAVPTRVAMTSEMTGKSSSAATMSVTFAAESITMTGATGP